MLLPHDKGATCRHLWSCAFAILCLYPLMAQAQTSTAAHPCGAPEQGRFVPPPEAPRTGAITTINLTVQQEGFLLCFVWQGVAQAPVIRVRPGDELIVNLTSQISDPCFINFYFGGGSCGDRTDAKQPVDPPSMAMSGMHSHPMPSTATGGSAANGYYPVIPNVPMSATGITNVHTHGLSVSPALHQDEVIKTQIVPPAMAKAGHGSNQWTYDFKIPADHLPGLYWYHPHFHGETEPQAMMGLSGAIVVEDAQDDRRAAAGIADQILIVRDHAASQTPGAQADSMASRNALAGRHMRSGFRRGAAAPAVSHALVSSPGITVDPKINQVDQVACDPSQPPVLFENISINGQPVREGQVEDTMLPVISMSPREQRLIRLLNASADAYFLPALVDAAPSGNTLRLPLQIVARDGAPIMDAHGFRTIATHNPAASLIVPPGGRVEFVLTAPERNHKIYLTSDPFDTGCVGDANPGRTVVRFVTDPSNAAAPPSGRNWPSGLAGFNAPYDQPATVQRTFAFTEYPPDATNPNGTPDFYITEIAGPDVDPGKVTIAPFDMNATTPNITINLKGEAIHVEEWTIQNYTVEAHAFHIHQLHFRQEFANAATSRAQPLLDVIHVPNASVNPDGTPGTPGQVKLKMVFTPNIAGVFVYHCHILFHEDSGMMGTIRINP